MCSKTCGTGITRRTRTVKVHAECGGKPCAGPTEESKECKVGCCKFNGSIGNI